MTAGRLIRDDQGRTFRLPYGRASAPSWSIQWEDRAGWHVLVFPGLVARRHRIDAEPKVATA